ncbi:ABC transporter ATP-binding protein [Tsukamurella sp. 8F]|uniref:ABC transporter ATP-binding protein n=1 Tax=unclassified Tsukamurella TaxID=2633480 RepID=UPI0023BA15DC|nr:MULTISPECIES: ABC transporter ATP-binding protein [unclassified Tsukamurella]MDF0530421.1 ABC transporter ATP-binding protein [Tsukamurella sp. 8J]MDF0587758.1 ABC transporter ATP-binding protein [Tsukamurella sp. 8F]
MNTTAIGATRLDQAPAISVRDLRKTFRGPHGAAVTAVDGINLTIGAGEVVAFLGPNGAGKTTTIDMLLGLTRPVGGGIEVFGTSPEQAARGGRVSAVMQSGGLLPEFTVEETVRVVASTFGVTDTVDDVMARASISSIAGRKVSKCSGGEQQRLKFALALLPDPDLIVLDEPTAGMDVESRRAFWATMRADAGEGRTVLFATHYLEEADDFADRIIMMAAGRVVADGTTAEIRAQASGRVVSAVLGREELSRVRAAIPAITDVTVRGGRAFLTSSDSDAVGRYLFTQTSARDVEIAAPNLEDAFISLTRQPGSEEVPA